MIIGLGSGTTVQEFIKLCGEEVKKGLDVDLCNNMLTLQGCWRIEKRNILLNGYRRTFKKE